MFPDSNSRSARLYERARRVLPDGGSRSTIRLDPHPIYVREGRGARVIDVDGNELIDFSNNYTSLIHGHAHPAIAAAVTAQIRRGTAFAFGTEAEVRLAETLCGRVASFERIRFANSGSEAVMTALKAARAYTGRPKIAKCEGAYHGTYDYAEVSLETGPELWNAPEPRASAYARGTPQGVLDDVVVIPFNDTETARRLLEAHADELACVLIDPMPNRAGLIPARRDFLDMLVEVTGAHGVLLVFDEVIAFRMGSAGHQGVLEVAPDLTTLGKLIGGGFPVGAVAGRAEVMAVFEVGEGGAALPHGGTFNANPVTMAAGQACLDLLTPEAYARLNEMGEAAREMLSAAFRAAGAGGQVSGAGSLFRLHLHERPLEGYRSARPTANEAAAMARLHRHLINAGVFIAPTGLGCLSTPMVEGDIERLADAVEGGLKAL